ncbi:glycosyltransferase family 39 protein, partial [Candidatus Sumerlaeota bacterium]|nr:glycosyltransferase family 39 protein [Candidatus Sumerlaeota bacterium]
MNDSILFTRTETASAPPLFTRRSEFLPLALIVVCTVVALSPLMQAVFVWDDDRYITNNTTLHTLDGFEKIWTRPSSMPDPYPLVMTAFWAMYQIWSDNAPFYHAVNITLHTLNAYLLWLLLRRLGIPGALLAALIFAVHPMHVESVAHISELKDVMSGLFYFLTLHAWLRFRGTGRQEHYYHAVILYACAMMSKTVTCSLPPTL